MKHYHYIIAGAGCAGLSLAVRLVTSGKFRAKKILLVDKSPRVQNDHTWCFWETSAGFFEPIVYKQWSQLYFHSEKRSSLLDIDPFRYKMIRAIDFYKYCFEQLGKQKVDIEYGEITSVFSTADNAYLTVGEKTFSADYIFSSILPATLTKQSGKHYFLQHFKGWVIETGVPCFDASAATLMDFRVPQQHGACFVYILPIVENRAMIECTFFSKNMVPPEIYEAILLQYLSVHLQGMSYQVVEEEKGIIPMTNHTFPKQDKRIVYLGTAAGNTKPSSGYTFQFIQAHSQKLTEQLIATGQPYLKSQHFSRFLFYDTILLRVLADGKLPADKIFERLFHYNAPQRVLKFLGNESTRLEELKIIASLPKTPFLKAAFGELKNFLQSSAKLNL